jgi:carotenoid cleavage dioxygenase-like enzyme
MSALSYRAGFQEAVEIEPTQLTWEGAPPTWLKGTLFRNGPGRFDRGKEQVSHWFDGLALLHALTIDGETLTYRSHFVRSREYRQSQQSGRIDSPGFACDPCRNLFRKVASAFCVDATDNTNINVIKHGQRYLALTELPVAVEFDPHSLRTLRSHTYSDRVADGATTAHPHQEGELLFNQVLHYSATPTYRFYHQRELEPRQEFGRVTVDQVSYVHSFGMSTHWMVLTCCPLQVAPWKLLVRDRPFIENFRWQPETGTRFHLLPKPGGKGQQRTLKSEPFFAFHHINSFENDGTVLVDLVAYDDARVIEQLRLARLARGEGVDFGRFRRYRCDPKERWVERVQQSRHVLELPNIPYRSHNTRPYRYVYGISADADSSLFYDRLIKLEVDTDQALYWHQDHCFPGEPVFVNHPQDPRNDSNQEEDRGVLLSLVLAGADSRSFLLVLDAKTMAELARAYLPSVAPHGFHGFFEPAL